MLAQITLNLNSSHPSENIFVGAVIVGILLWLCTLVSLLGRQDMKDADKIVWTIVVCTLNILGMLLYWCMAPSQPPVKIRSEQELKDYFNSRSQEPREKVSGFV
jgi:Phospholipase_D-nuclease N-terminal